MTRNTVNIPNVKFVDNNTALTGGTSINSMAKEVMVKAQKELDDWQTCSKVSGGTLNHAKTVTWIWEQVWSDDHWRMRTDKSLLGTLHLEDEEGARRHHQEIETDRGPQNTWCPHHRGPHVEGSDLPIDRTGSGLCSKGQNMKKQDQI